MLSDPMKNLGTLKIKNVHAYKINVKKLAGIRVHSNFFVNAHCASQNEHCTELRTSFCNRMTLRSCIICNPVVQFAHGAHGK